MLKKAGEALEKWGHYALALLCAAAILLSALWTRDQKQAEAPEAQALNDQSQRLSDAQSTAAPEEDPLVRPVSGSILRGYEETAVYSPENGVWRIHRAADFAAREGETVLAMAAGTVISCQGAVRVDHGNGRESCCRGLSIVFVQPGQQVEAGQALGTAGGKVPFEGEICHVCVSWTQDGRPVDIFQSWSAEE